MTITWNQLLSGIFVLACVASGATFTIVKYATESEMRGYLLSISNEKENIKTLEKRLSLCFKSNSRDTTIKNEANSSLDYSNSMLKIVTPLSGKLVNKRDFVQVETIGEMPLGYKAYLYIRDPLGQWWSWGEIQEGIRMEVQFGESGDEEERFEVRVQLSDEVISKGGPHVILPGAVVSDSVIVVRK